MAIGPHVQAAAGYDPRKDLTPIGRIGATPMHPARDMRIAVLAFLAAMPIVLALLATSAALARWLGQEPDHLAHELLRMFVAPEFAVPARVVLVTSVVLLGPALEEIVYRGLIQSSVVELIGRSRRCRADSSRRPSEAARPHRWRSRPSNPFSPCASFALSDRPGRSRFRPR